MGDRRHGTWRGKVTKAPLWAGSEARGEYTLVDKNDLKIDHQYQRTRVISKVGRIATHFHWVAFGALIVARRKNGDLFVLDGQNRLAAALKRDEVESVPCLVWDVVDEPAFEAEMFLLVNTNRKPLTALEQFKAQVESHEAIALKMMELLDRHGYSIPVSGKHLLTDGRWLQCVSTFRKCLTNWREETIRVFDLVVSIADGKPIANRVLFGVVICEYKLADGRSLLEPENQAKLINIGQERLISAMHRRSELERKGGTHVWADAVLEKVNERKRQKLRFD